MNRTSDGLGFQGGKHREQDESDRSDELVDVQKITHHTSFEFLNLI